MFKRKKDRTKQILTVLIAILIITLLTNIYLIWSLNQMMTLTREPPIWETSLVVPPSIEGYSLAEASTTPPDTILLTAGCSQLTMLTTEFQVASIQAGIDDMVGFRPTTHDIMADALENYKIETVMARVESLKDGTYYAKLVLNQQDRVLLIDSKPSDAIAVAVRFDAPIYISNELLGQYAEDIC